MRSIPGMPIVFTMLLATAAAAPAATLVAKVVGKDGKAIQNVVVVVVPEAGIPNRAGPPPIELVDQVDKEFTPYVKPIRVGSLVGFPNKDNVQHHVYSFSPAKAFELPLYKGTPAQPLLFDKPGVVRLGCNIHDWMIGYIYVSETPWFGKTDQAGLARIDKLPVGRNHVRVWHPWMIGPEEATVRIVDLAEAQPVALQWQIALEPEFGSRRAPMPGDAGYR